MQSQDVKRVNCVGDSEYPKTISGESTNHNVAHGVVVFGKENSGQRRRHSATQSFHSKITQPITAKQRANELRQLSLELRPLSLAIAHSYVRAAP